MTPDQQQRLAVAETEIRELRADIQRVEERLEAANEKLDRIVSTMDKGQGAFWLFIRAAALIAAIGAGASWLANHVRL